MSIIVTLTASDLMQRLNASMSHIIKEGDEARVQDADLAIKIRGMDARDAFDEYNSSNANEARVKIERMVMAKQLSAVCAAGVASSISIDLESHELLFGSFKQ